VKLKTKATRKKTFEGKISRQKRRQQIEGDDEKTKNGKKINNNKNEGLLTLFVASKLAPRSMRSAAVSV